MAERAPDCRRDRAADRGLESMNRRIEDGDRLAEPWSSVPATLRARGLRWTPQRRLLLEVLSRINGHVTGAELVDQCRALDPDTTPSTVYRTLDVLEEVGLVRHGHGADGREEYHVLPGVEHGHLYCGICGGTQEIGEEEVVEIASVLQQRHAFTIDGSHVTIVGTCAGCLESDAGAGAGDSPGHC